MRWPTDLSIHQIAKEVHSTNFTLLPCTPKGPVPFRCLSSHSHIALGNPYPRPYHQITIVSFFLSLLPSTVIDREYMCKKSTQMFNGIHSFK